MQGISHSLSVELEELLWGRLFLHSPEHCSECLSANSSWHVTKVFDMLRNDQDMAWGDCYVAGVREQTWTFISLNMSSNHGLWTLSEPCQDFNWISSEQTHKIEDHLPTVWRVIWSYQRLRHQELIQQKVRVTFSQKIELSCRFECSDDHRIHSSIPWFHPVPPKPLVIFRYKK